jgi:hypothetical protein
MHHLFLGSRDDMDTIVDAIDKIVEKQEGSRERDHKAIRSLRLSWAIRESWTASAVSGCEFYDEFVSPKRPL